MEIVYGPNIGSRDLREEQALCRPRCRSGRLPIFDTCT